MRIHLKILVFVMILTSCQNSKKEVYSALEKFDSSLDSLLIKKVYEKPKVLIFQDDTLRGNPKIIKETCYQIIGKDSIKIDANCHLYKFKNNELVINSSQNLIGEKFVQKFVYFKDKIDNKLIDDLRNTISDTVYFGCVNKYDENGKKLKKVKYSFSKEIKKDGTILISEDRILEIYKYNHGNSVTTCRKEYFNKQYNVDSLKNTKIKKFASSESSSWDLDKYNYSYKRDKYGNWIEKKSNKTENPNVYYRKIMY
ncbi:hypothetical protein KHA90_22550 [Flavobacterium psychroterrae]|uniref:DKNYY domain-containing protein n=1 Tax=Flavobacterium psychroterrae TaxID=2133767 RepID=A0ABS5PHP5_9FLAO|nr:hypothetical protein [Flavobacterium psychroterrae]MBS7233802.1 hypothetical protein [Flavobacterium psychroterrae]